MSKVREFLRPYSSWTLNKITEPMDMLANMENMFIVARDLLLAADEVVEAGRHMSGNWEEDPKCPKDDNPLDCFSEELKKVRDAITRYDTLVNELGGRV